MASKFFHEGMIDQLKYLSSEELQSLRVLISDSKSRDLVDVYWLIEYGCPALCIKNPEIKMKNIYLNSNPNKSVQFYKKCATRQMFKKFL